MQQELLPRFEGEHRMWIKTPMSPDLTYATAIIRAPRQGAFEVQARRRIEQVHPHLEQAMHLHLELARSRELSASLESGFDRIATGFILLGRSGLVLFANRAARAVMDARRGLGLHRGRLTATFHAENGRLQLAITDALRNGGGAAGQTVMLDGEDGNPVCLRVMPLATRSQVLTPRAGAVVLLSDTGLPPLSTRAC